MHLVWLTQAKQSKQELDLQKQPAFQSEPRPRSCEGGRLVPPSLFGVVCSVFWQAAHRCADRVKLWLAGHDDHGSRRVPGLSPGLTSKDAVD